MPHERTAHEQHEHNGGNDQRNLERLELFLGFQRHIIRPWIRRMLRPGVLPHRSCTRRPRQPAPRVATSGATSGSGVAIAITTAFLDILRIACDETVPGLLTHTSTSAPAVA